MTTNKLSVTFDSRLKKYRHSLATDTETLMVNCWYGDLLEVRTTWTVLVSIPLYRHPFSSAMALAGVMMSLALMILVRSTAVFL